MAALNIRGVPEFLSREFRALCIQRGTTMTAEAIRLIADELRRAGVKLPKEVHPK